MRITSSTYTGDSVEKAKDGGVDVIHTYVFWGGHESSPGNYYFEDRYDLVRFVKLVKQAGLYVNIRIGPYVCAEWNFGRFPVWLKYIPGISFRTDNEALKTRMAKFSAKIVDMMKAEDLFEWQCGPIILAHIENEFGPEDNGGTLSKSYSTWAAKMSVGLGTGVQWLMCKQSDAIDPIIDTCNGFYCNYFSPNKPYNPKIWTEAWTGCYTSFGDSVTHPPVEDLAFSVVRFIQKGGSYINYYMYHGGTNFDRTDGGPFVATSYDYDAPIGEYGLVRQPKWSHLRELHRGIKICEPGLLEGAPVAMPLGKYKQSYVFRTKEGRGCVALLSNYDPQSYAKLEFNGQDYHLPPVSISILPDRRNVVFNTAIFFIHDDDQIGGHTSLMKMQEVAGGFLGNHTAMKQPMI